MPVASAEMILLLILHVANGVIPSLGDLRSVNAGEVSNRWGDDIGSVWWPLLRHVFKKAKSVQVMRLSTTGTVGHAIWTDLVPNLHRRLRKSITVWNSSNEDFVRNIQEMDNANDDARYFLLVIGSEFLRQLSDFSSIWFSRSNYVILVEDRYHCSKHFNFLFRHRMYFMLHLFFVRSSCPEIAFIVKPDVPNSSVMLRVNNVTTAVSLWNRNIPDFRNSTWKVALFDRYPTSFRVNESKQKWTDFEGIDGFFLETISDHYKMQPIMVYPEDGQTYGAYENDTATGTLGIVLRGEADIALNGRFLIDYGTNEIAFTTPYLTDKLCLMAPRSKRIPSYIAMFRCFDKPAWLLLLLTYVVGSCVWRSIAGFTNKTRAWVLASLDVYYMILSGIFSKSSRRSLTARIFIASCLLFSVVFMGAFQGLLYQSMTSPTYYPELNTLDEVDRSGLPIATASLSLKDAFPPDDDDPLIKRLRSKLFIVRDEALWNKIKEDESNYAVFWRRNGAFLRLHRSQMHLHLVDECPRSHFLSFVLQKKSPFLQIVNSFITRCSEHGLLHLWRERTYKFTAKDLLYMQEYKRDLTVELDQVQAPFFLLCIGLTGSLLVFVYEVIGRHRERNTAPRITWWRYASSGVKRLFREPYFRQHKHTHFTFLH